MREGGKRKPLAEILDQAFHSQPSEMTQQLCNKLVNDAIALTKQKLLYYVEKKHVLHIDPRETNVLFPFDDNTSTLGIPELIDWGEWIERTVGKDIHCYVIITDQFPLRFGMNQAVIGESY